MVNHIQPGSNGSAGKSMIDICPVGEGCSLFIPNPKQPPPENELHIALSEVLQKWLLTNPVHVRTALPITHNGTTVALFIWWEQAAT